MLVSTHSLIWCDLLSLNPILFICNFPVLFFHMTTTKSFISKPIFWCTTLITLYIQIHAKGRLNKLLPLLLIFWVAFAPCLCTTPCRLKGNLKDCYAGHILLYSGKIESYLVSLFEIRTNMPQTSIRFDSVLHNSSMCASKLRSLSLIKPSNLSCDNWSTFVASRRSFKVAVSTQSLCCKLFPVTSNVLVFSLLMYILFSVDHFSIFSKSLERAWVKDVILFQFALTDRVVSSAYISVVELFKCKGISFTNMRNKTEPRIDLSGTPCLTGFGSDCYMP